jgi:hypothetical protein
VAQLLLIHLPPFEHSVDEIVDDARGWFQLAEPALDGTGLTTPVR